MNPNQQDDDGCIAFHWKCPECGLAFDHAPTSVFFQRPDAWLGIEEIERDRRPNFATDDFCLIENPDQIDRFVRCILEAPIIGHPEPFLWGVWISLSEQNFEWVRSTWHLVDPPEAKPMAGYVCNDLPLYPADPALTADIVLQPHPHRPLAFLHRREHRLYREQQFGMTMDRVVELAPILLKHRCDP